MRLSIVFRLKIYPGAYRSLSMSAKLRSGNGPNAFAAMDLRCNRRRYGTGQLAGSSKKKYQFGYKIMYVSTADYGSGNRFNWIHICELPA